MLSSPVGVVTDLDGTVVFGGVADPRLAPFLRRAAGREDISVIVATSRAPRGMAEVLGDAVTCLEGSVCLNGALLRLGDKERRYPMRADHVRAVVDAAFRAGMPLYVDQGSSFTALAGHDPVAEPRSGEVSAAVSDFAASPETTAEKETRRRGSQDSETEPGIWEGLEHMRDYPDGTWCTDPAQVPTEDVLKVTVVSRRYQGRAGQDIIRQRIADPLQGAAGPGTRAAGAQETGGPEPAGTLQDLVGLRLDGVVAYPHEDGVVDVCAAGVDKSICMRLMTGEEEPAASGRGGYHRKDSRHGAGTGSSPPACLLLGRGRQRRQRRGDDPRGRHRCHRRGRPGRGQGEEADGPRPLTPRRGGVHSGAAA